MDFWNESIPGREETEIKTRETAMAAVLYLDLVGKVICVKREKKLYLINLTFTETDNNNGSSTST
jgi:hypothetical protein